MLSSKFSGVCLLFINLNKSNTYRTPAHTPAFSFSIAAITQSCGRFNVLHYQTAHFYGGGPGKQINESWLKWDPVLVPVSYTKQFL
jgi:hypothetical protein